MKFIKCLETSVVKIHACEFEDVTCWVTGCRFFRDEALSDLGPRGYDNELSFKRECNTQQFTTVTLDIFAQFPPLARAPIVSGLRPKLFSSLRKVKIPIFYKKSAGKFEATY